MQSTEIFVARINKRQQKKVQSTETIAAKSITPTKQKVQSTEIFVARINKRQQTKKCRAPRYLLQETINTSKPKGAEHQNNCSKKQ
ncbi:hypothetical protein LXL81_17630 [Dyadobacter sp. CY356]|nr:hypothetical protein [Dyadobacter sp. CY356]